MRQWRQWGHSTFSRSLLDHRTGSVVDLADPLPIVEVDLGLIAIASVGHDLLDPPLAPHPPFRRRRLNHFHYCGDGPPPSQAGLDRPPRRRRLHGLHSQERHQTHCGAALNFIRIEPTTHRAQGANRRLRLTRPTLVVEFLKPFGNLGGSPVHRLPPFRISSRLRSTRECVVEVSRGFEPTPKSMSRVRSDPP